MNNKELNSNDYLANNRKILINLNDNIMSLTNIIHDHNSKLNRITSDLESIKSYINNQEILKNEKIKDEKEISRGWFFGY